MEEIEKNEGNGNPIKPAYKTKLVWIGVFGLLLGMVIKTEAVKRVTIGFDDYKLSGIENRYDFLSIEREIKAREEAAQKAQLEAVVPGDSQAEDVQPEDSADSSCEGDGESCQP